MAPTRATTVVPSPLTVTSSKAPASRAGSRPRAAHKTPLPDPHAVLTASDSAPEPEREKIPHHGFVADANVGVLGCFGSTCAGRHQAQPGVRVGGFIGGNIRGYLSIGIAGGWGTLRSQVRPGTNALALYGLDAHAVMREFDTAAGNTSPIDFTRFAVDDATIRNAQGGPVMRIHLIPRGRMTAWIGSGAYYNYFSSAYRTSVGQLRLDMHGIAVPIEAGLGVYVAKNVALTAQFDYLWTWYALARITAPEQNLTVPISMLDDAGREHGADFADGLPRLWTAGFGLRARI